MIHAHQLRYRSYLLADQLRQSGDDLTRMVQMYVVTGDPVYKQHFQDIRDGRKPRPVNPQRPYWGLVLGNGVAPRASQSAIPLLELMRQAGFSEQEFARLAQAKANSDALTGPEIAAMKLVESPGPPVQADRDRAVGMLFDGKYMAAKRGVMKPIDEFMAMLDRRTAATAKAAESRARGLRYLFIALGLALMFTLWRAYAALRATLGGSLHEVASQISRIGSGDFSPAVGLKAVAEASVLGWLAVTRAQLFDNERQREQADAALRAEIAAREQVQLALTRRAEEMIHFNAAAVGREVRMIELKQEVNALANQLGQPPPYAPESPAESPPDKLEPNP